MLEMITPDDSSNAGHIGDSIRSGDAVAVRSEPRQTQQLQVNLPSSRGETPLAPVNRYRLNPKGGSSVDRAGPEAKPGAYCMRGRAFGDIPVWLREANQRARAQQRTGLRQSTPTVAGRGSLRRQTSESRLFVARPPGLLRRNSSTGSMNFGGGRRRSIEMQNHAFASVPPEHRVTDDAFQTPAFSSVPPEYRIDEGAFRNFENVIQQVQDIRPVEEQHIGQWTLSPRRNGQRLINRISRISRLAIPTRRITNVRGRSNSTEESR